MLGHFLLGAAIGAATGVPIGVVGAAVIDAAYRHPRRRAVGVGLGGGCGDLVYAALAVLGIGPLLASSPHAQPALFSLSGIALVAYGAVRLRSGHAAPSRCAAEEHSLPRHAGTNHGRTGFKVGLGLVLANPASVVTWVVIVGAVMGGFGAAEIVVSVLGIGAGSAAWYFVLAHIARRATRSLGDRMLWITRTAGAGLMAYGLMTLVRGAHDWLALA
jgi:threonine/homoserine/homoserine lactone efflux protein